MLLIDVHSHVSPLAFPQSPSASLAHQWPCMQCASPKTGTLMIGDKAFRALDSRSWDAEHRLGDMDRDGIGIQVLSPMPELLSYWLDVDAAAILCDHSNHQIAEMAALHRDRFRGLGAICLQRPDRAFQDLSRIKSHFGLSGVEIGSNINGVLLGDPTLEPFYAAAAELDLAIFVHALHPLATKIAPVGQAFTAFAGFPVDVAMAISSIVMAGVLDRYPNLRIGFSHGGGAIGAMLGRLDVGWEKTGGFDGATSTRPSEQARMMFFDSNVYDPSYLRHLAIEVAPGQVFAGTDYPYAIMQAELATFLRQADLNQSDEKSLFSGAGLRFLGESSE